MSTLDRKRTLRSTLDDPAVAVLMAPRRSQVHRRAPGWELDMKDSSKSWAPWKKGTIVGRKAPACSSFLSDGGRGHHGDASFKSKWTYGSGLRVNWV